MKYIIRKIVEYKTVDELMKKEGGIHIHEISVTPFSPSYSDNRSLSPRQKELLDFLYLRKKNLPSLKEMATFLKVGSINTVVDHIKALEVKGYTEGQA